MTKENLLNIFESRPQYQKFLKRECKYLDVRIDDVDILFFAEESGVGAYLRYPYVLNDQHEHVISFLKYAIPELSERVEEQRLKDLNSK